MQSAPPEPKFLRVNAKLLCSTLLVVGILCSSLLSWVLQKDKNREDEARFERVSARLGNSIREQFDALAQIVSGAAAMVLTQEETSREEWTAYFDQIHAFAPRSLHGLGLVELKSPPEAKEPLDCVEVLFMEPSLNHVSTGATRLALMPEFRAALLESLSRHDLTISARVILESPEGSLPCVFIVMPVSAAVVDKNKPPKPPKFMVFGIFWLDAVLLNARDTVNPTLDFELYDKTNLQKPLYLFDADDHLRLSAKSPTEPAPKPARRFASLQSLRLLGHDFFLSTSASEAFINNASFSTPALLVFFGGLGLTVASVSGFWTLQLSRERALILARDMTASLRESEEKSRKLALIVQKTKGGVLLTDARGHVDWVNDSFTAITGHSLDRIRGKHVRCLFLDKTAGLRLFRRMRAQLRAQNSFSDQIKLTRSDGSPCWVQLEVQDLRDAEGKLSGFMAIQNDVTERHRFEHELMEAKTSALAAQRSAENATHAKSVFLATMSHEIRTPMNGIMGMTSILLDTPLSDQQREYAEIIRTSSDTLLTIINDILDFSKIESGKIELEACPFNLIELIENALELLHPKATGKNIGLYATFDDSMPSTFVGDPTRINQIILNLLGNAVKFTESGEVEIHVRPLTASELAPDQAQQSWLQFSVRDTGIGIPREARSRIFNAFAQGDASTTRRFGGTGLGLAISKRLVERMRGDLSFESEEGRGTTFYVRIPLPHASTTSVNTPPSGLEGRRVLIVGELPTSARSLSGILRRLGLNPHWFEDPRIAKELMLREPVFDGVLLGTGNAELDRVGTELAAALPDKTAILRWGLIPPEDRGRRENKHWLRFPLRQAPVQRALQQAFRLTSQIAEASKTPTDSSPKELTKVEVLLVEDNIVNQRVALHMLASLGYQAASAADGLQAIEQFRLKKFDIILMDMHMPNLNGLEATKTIRTLSTSTKPWIIALTASAQESNKRECLEAGMNDFLGKPINARALKQALDRAQQALPRLL